MLANVQSNQFRYAIGKKGGKRTLTQKCVLFGFIIILWNVNASPKAKVWPHSPMNNFHSSMSDCHWTVATCQRTSKGALHCGWISEFQRKKMSAYVFLHKQVELEHAGWNESWIKRKCSHFFLTLLNLLLRENMFDILRHVGGHCVCLIHNLQNLGSLCY